MNTCRSRFIGDEDMWEPIHRRKANEAKKPVRLSLAKTARGKALGAAGAALRGGR
jgi:hypothetical protein